MNKLSLLATVPLVFSLAGCRNSKLSTVPERAVSVHTITIVPTQQNGSVQVAGVVIPQLEADLASQILAPVASVTKREGDRFRRGDPLVRLRAPALGADVAQANAALTNAARQQDAASSRDQLAAATLSRYAQLRERHSVTPYELDKMQALASAARAEEQGAQAQMAAARSALAAQRANASDAVIYAPFDGVVTKRMVDPGAMAAPGVPLLHVQSAGQSKVEFSAPEELARFVQVGSEIGVSWNGSSLVRVKIASISPAGDAGSHAFVMKAVLPPFTAWGSGTVVQVFLPAGHEVSSILVPSRAIVQQGGLDAVLLATPDGRAQVRYVTLGAANRGQTNILSGLRPDDRVLAQGDLGLAGHKIEVRP